MGCGGAGCGLGAVMRTGACVAVLRVGSGWPDGEVTEVICGVSVPEGEQFCGVHRG